MCSRNASSSVAGAGAPKVPPGRGSRTRLAVILSHPTQYYSPWFRWLATHTSLQLRVFYLWEFGVTSQRDRQFSTTFRWDVDLLSGYDHEFVPNRSGDPGTHHFRGLDNPALVKRLAAWQPAALLMFGYNSRSHLTALAWARWRGIPVVFRGDSHFLGRGAPSWSRTLLWRSLYAQFAAFLPVGAANTSYFQTLGVPDRKLFFAPHAVDASLFDPANVAHHEAAAQLRRALQLGTAERVVLFAGKLVPAKQPRALLEAFLRVAPPETTLVFVGDGQEGDSLRQLAAKHSGARIRFLPFANQTQMPARYLLADVFALPSRGHYETWGLAVNEAMHLGVPALVSDRVGCQQDLVTDGETGWVFPSETEGALEGKLAEAVQAVRTPERRAALRSRVLHRIARYSYAAASEGLLRALASITSAPPP